MVVGDAVHPGQLYAAEQAAFQGQHWSRASNSCSEWTIDFGHSECTG